jgi:predicted MFS family arabinose efflux permease
LIGLGAALAALGFSLNAEWALMATLMPASLLAQLFFPAQQASLARDYREHRATVLAWNNSALFLGISLGSLIGGQAVAIGGFTVDTTLGAMIAAAAAALVVTPVRGWVMRVWLRPVAANGSHLISRLTVP